MRIFGTMAGMGDDPRLPPMFDRAYARGAGFSDRQITYRLATGIWVAERRGQLRVTSDLARGGGTEDLGYDVMAALRSMRAGSVVVSHASAARCWRLPKPLDGWGDVTVTTEAGNRRHRAGVHVRSAPLPDDHLVPNGAYAITSVARTVADCLRSLPPLDALAIADSAIHRGLTSVDAIAAVLTTQTGWPGSVQARQVLALVDGRRESPLESWTAWALAEEGVAPPHWQISILAPTALFIARVDAWWDEGVVGEADGRAKYRLAAAERGGASARTLDEVLTAERRREEAIRDVGADVVRWGAGDVLRPGRRAHLASKIRERRLAAARTGAFRGTAVYIPSAGAR